MTYLRKRDRRSRGRAAALARAEADGHPHFLVQIGHPHLEAFPHGRGQGAEGHAADDRAGRSPGPGESSPPPGVTRRTSSGGRIRPRRVRSSNSWRPASRAGSVSMEMRTNLISSRRLPGSLRRPPRRRGTPPWLMWKRSLSGSSLWIGMMAWLGQTRSHMPQPMQAWAGSVRCRMP